MCSDTESIMVCVHGVKKKHFYKVCQLSTLPVQPAAWWCHAGQCRESNNVISHVYISPWTHLTVVCGINEKTAEQLQSGSLTCDRRTLQVTSCLLILYAPQTGHVAVPLCFLPFSLYTISWATVQYGFVSREVGGEGDVVSRQGYQSDYKDSRKMSP